jgi:hypothetical protein
MGGYIRIEDICRNRITGLHSLRSGVGEPPVSPAQTELEMGVAIELLRATPRFWNAAGLWVAASEQTPGYVIRIINLQGFPTHATATSRLRLSIARLFETMESVRGVAWRGLILHVSWSAPRVWAYEVGYEYVGHVSAMIECGLVAGDY